MSSGATGAKRRASKDPVHDRRRRTTPANADRASPNRCATRASPRTARARGSTLQSSRRRPQHPKTEEAVPVLRKVAVSVGRAQVRGAVVEGAAPQPPRRRPLPPGRIPTQPVARRRGRPAERRARRRSEDPTWVREDRPEAEGRDLSEGAQATELSRTPPDGRSGPYVGSDRGRRRSAAGRPCLRGGGPSARRALASTSTGPSNRRSWSAVLQASPLLLCARCCAKIRTWRPTSRSIPSSSIAPSS